MDAGIVALGSSAFTGAVTVAGLLLRQRDKREDRREAVRRQIEARPDLEKDRLQRALDEADERAKNLYEQLKVSDSDTAALRVQLRSAFEQVDRYMGEAQDLRRKLDENRRDMEEQKLKNQRLENQ